MQRQPDVSRRVVQRWREEGKVGLYVGKRTADATSCREDRVTARGQPVTAFNQRKSAVVDDRTAAGDDAVGIAVVI